MRSRSNIAKATNLHFILGGFSKTVTATDFTQLCCLCFSVKNRKQIHNHRHIDELFREVLVWLPPWVLYYLGFQKSAKPADTKPQAFGWITQRAPFVATHLHFILTGFLKTAKSCGHTRTGILVNYPEAFLGGYLPTFYINFIFQKLQTHKHSHFSELPRAPWVATYLHLIKTGYSKTTKSRRHTSTGILVKYLEAFLGGYLLTFYINWISKSIKSPRHKSTDI